MARTLYESRNAEFSQLAHQAAREMLYPRIFHAPASALTYECPDQWGTQQAEILDGQMGIDKIVSVQLKDFFAPICLTIQERFREVEYASWRDITLTEWNKASGLPSELYKIKAHLFVYGYYDKHRHYFREAVAVDIPKLLLELTLGRLAYDHSSNKKSQTFITFGFENLASRGCLLYHGKNIAAEEEIPEDFLEEPSEPIMQSNLGEDAPVSKCIACQQPRESNASHAWFCEACYAERMRRFEQKDFLHRVR